MNKNTIREELQNLVTSQRALMAQSKKNESKIDNFQREIEKILSSRLQKFGVNALCGLSGGCRTPDWAPNAHVYPYYSTRGGVSYGKINGVWCWYEGSLSSKAYAHKILKTAEPAPFSGEELEKVCAELSEELGIPVQFVESTAKLPDRLENTNDLLATYPGSKILGSGEIWTMGWDIPDHWAILQDDKGVHVFYSTNGHGFGYDFHLEPGQDFSPFIELIKDEGFEGADLAQSLLGIR